MVWLAAAPCTNYFFFAVTVWDRHRAVVHWGGSKELQCRPNRAFLLVARGIWSCHPSTQRGREETFPGIQRIRCDTRSCACSVWWCHASDTHFYRSKISLFVEKQNSVTRMHSVSPSGASSLRWRIVQVLCACVLYGWQLERSRVSKWPSTRITPVL
jgi:hypothetical protein